MLLCVFLVRPTKFENTLNYMQHIFDAWEFKRMDWKSLFWENLVQNLCFWKTLHLIFMNFIHNFQSFKEFMHKTGLFFKTVFFPKFRSLKAVFRSIEIAIKNFRQPLSISINPQLILDQSKHFRLIEPNFRSIENRMESFLKHLILMC